MKKFSITKLELKVKHDAQFFIAITNHLTMSIYFIEVSPQMKSRK